MKPDDTKQSQIKQRLIGLITLFALAAIFIPVLLDEKSQAPVIKYVIPHMPIDAELIQLEPGLINQPDASQITKIIESLQYNFF